MRNQDSRLRKMYAAIPSEQRTLMVLDALAKNDDGTYRSKFLNLSHPEILRFRESMLLETVRCYRPDVLLVDKAPLGVCRELVPALHWLRENRPSVRMIFGMRDIEDDPKATIAQWSRDRVQREIENCYHEVWVYGERSIFDVASKYELSQTVNAKLRYMGYVARQACEHPRRDAGEPASVLVTVGGGTDGESVLDAYLGQAAECVSRRHMRSVIVGGPDLPKEASDRLRERAGRIDGVEWRDFETCMSCRIRAAELVISMGGYNTLCELAVQRKPALIVPRITPRLEQDIRARLWEKLCPVRVLSRQELSDQNMATRVTDMLDSPPRLVAPRIDLGGLDRVADRFDEFIFEESGRAIALRM